MQQPSNGRSGTGCPIPLLEVLVLDSGGTVMFHLSAAAAVLVGLWFTVIVVGTARSLFRH